MPRKRRRPKHRLRHAFTERHAFQLVVGVDFFSDAYGRPQGETLERMAADWAQHREQVIEKCRSRGTRLRPWAFWRFDHDYDEPPRGIEAEAAALRELGELTAEDEALLEDRRQRRAG